LLAEIALRFAGYGSLEIYVPDARLYWRLKPSQDCFTKVDRRPVRINLLGTRGSEFAAQKPPEVFRVLSLGDSRTFGWGLHQAETFSDELGGLLQAWFRGEFGTATPRVEVINGGVNAWSYQQMAVFYREVAAAWQPDVVILAEANLWTQFSEDNSPEFVRQFLNRVRLKNFLRRFALYHYVVEVKLRAYYERHRTKFIPVQPEQDALFPEQQRSDPDAVFREAIESLCLQARSNGALPLLIHLPVLEDLSATNDGRVLRLKRELAAQYNLPFVDVTPELRGGGNALYLADDPVHFNAAGNQVIARRLYESLTNLILK